MPDRLRPVGLDRWRLPAIAFILRSDVRQRSLYPDGAGNNKFVETPPSISNLLNILDVRLGAPTFRYDGLVGQQNNAIPVMIQI
jgi:hypothetical protein